jgi:hypothetical protein
MRVVALPAEAAALAHAEAVLLVDHRERQTSEAQAGTLQRVRADRERGLAARDGRALAARRARADVGHGRGARSPQAAASSARNPRRCCAATDLGGRHERRLPAAHSTAAEHRVEGRAASCPSPRLLAAAAPSGGRLRRTCRARISPSGAALRGRRHVRQPREQPGVESVVDRQRRRATARPAPPPRRDVQREGEGLVVRETAARRARLLEPRRQVDRAQRRVERRQRARRREPPRRRASRARRRREIAARSFLCTRGAIPAGRR